jgi:DNA-binding CsgD family transcriptional regulator
VATLSWGLDLREAAAELGIRYNTARTQLRSVLEKCSLKRQSELMLRIARLR